MNRLFAIALTIITLLSLSACGGWTVEGKPGSDSSSVPTTQQGGEPISEGDTPALQSGISQSGGSAPSNTPSQPENTDIWKAIEASSHIGAQARYQELLAANPSIYDPDYAALSREDFSKLVLPADLVGYCKLIDLSDSRATITEILDKLLAGQSAASLLQSPPFAPYTGYWTTYYTSLDTDHEFPQHLLFGYNAEKNRFEVCGCGGEDDEYTDRLRFTDNVKSQLSASKLDLANTKATFCYCVTSGYLLTDGSHEYFLPVGNGILEAMGVMQRDHLYEVKEYSQLMLDQIETITGPLGGITPD